MQHQAERSQEIRVYLIRHAETPNNKHNSTIGGRSNHLKLTERGMKQAVALGQRLTSEGVKFDYVYASPAVRAISTADIVCGTLGGFKHPIRIRDDLQELYQGDWEGKKRSLVYTNEIIRRMTTDQPHFKAPNGESQLEVEKRMINVTEEWKAEAKQIDRSISVAVFGHGVAFKCLLRNILGSNPALTYRLTLDNCSITEVKYMVSGRHQGWHFLRINDHSHLRQVGVESADYKD